MVTLGQARRRMTEPCAVAQASACAHAVTSHRVVTGVVQCKGLSASNRHALRRRPCHHRIDYPPLRRCVEPFSDLMAAAMPDRSQCLMSGGRFWMAVVCGMRLCVGRSAVASLCGTSGRDGVPQSFCFALEGRPLALRLRRLRAIAQRNCDHCGSADDGQHPPANGQRWGRAVLRVTNTPSRTASVQPCASRRRHDSLTTDGGDLPCASAPPPQTLSESTMAHGDRTSRGQSGDRRSGASPAHRRAPSRGWCGSVARGLDCCWAPKPGPAEIRGQFGAAGGHIVGVTGEERRWGIMLGRWLHRVKPPSPPPSHLSSGGK